MPWASQEPLDFPTRRNIIHGFIEKFKQNQDFTFGIFSKKEKKCIGSTGLHTRLSSNEREIGYWLHVDYVSQGYITEAVSALSKVAFEVEKIAALEIHCHKDNWRSSLVPQRLGYLKIEKDNTAIDIWRLEQYQYLNNATIKNIDVRAYNAKGIRLL